jgi:hypothetical protein
MYPWPTGDFDNAMDVALDAAMNYLERTGQAEKFTEVQRAAAIAIVAAWKAGVRHRIKLADVAIKAVEPKAEPLFESQAIPETQLTSLGADNADNNEISRHRIYDRSRRRAALVEMVRIGCGRGDHGPSVP